MRKMKVRQHHVGWQSPKLRTPTSSVCISSPIPPADPTNHRFLMSHTLTFMKHLVTLSSLAITTGALPSFGALDADPLQPPAAKVFA